MTYNSWPFVSQATTDAQYSALFRALQRNGVVGVRGDSSLKGDAAGTDMNSRLLSGTAFVRGFFFENTATASLLHSPATSNPRVDRVVLRLDLTQAITNRVLPAVLTGTPAASNPAVPALTQIEGGVWEVPLYQVNIGASISAITPAMIVDERHFIGRQVGQWSTSTRPTSPIKGDLGLNETLGYYEFYDGATWKKLSSGVTWADVANKPTTSTLDGRTLYDGDLSPANTLGNNGDWYAEW